MVLSRLVKSPSDGSDGFALVAVLVFCLLLVPVVATFALSSKTSARTAHSATRSSKIEFLMDGLADVVASKLVFDRQFAEILAHGATCAIEGMSVTIRFHDHDGMIDLNNAGTELLRAGFEVTGLTEEQARLLQDYVEASRSGGALPRELMAIRDLPSIRGMPFERIEEIYDATQALNVRPRNLDDYFTVYKRSGSLELPAAARDLRDRLERGPQIEGVSGADNDMFEYADIVLFARSDQGRSYGLRKTYRRMSQTGDVRQIARKRTLSSGELAAIEATDNTSCLQLLITQDGEIGHG